MDAALEIFDAATAASGGAINCDYLVAGARLRLRFAGNRAAQLFGRAFAHLRVPDGGTPDLTLHLWDAVSTGTPPLRPGWGPEDYHGDGLIRPFNDDRFATAVETGPQVLRMVDAVAERGLYWIRDLANLPYGELAAPLRPLLHHWLWRRGRIPVHAGAVGLAHGGILLVGAGGAGKSNTAMSCIGSSLRYASDDFCVLAPEPEWSVHSLYSSGKLRDGDFVRHGRLRSMIDPAIERLDTEKHLLFIHEHQPASLIREFPLRAVVAPRVVGGDICRLVPNRGSGIAQALAISTMKMSWASTAATFEAAAHLVRTLPCYELQLGAQMDGVPDLLAGLLN
jgi:hypothetical protein